LRALVADDDADVRRMLGEVLHSRGARCVAACTGQERNARTSSSLT
jgi:CheY-like chemotaxis protein